MLKSNSLSTWPYFLETLLGSSRVQGVCSYSVFTFDPLYSLHLGKSKLVKECAVSYLSSDRHRTGGGRREEGHLLKYERGYFKGAKCCSDVWKVMGCCRELVKTF